MYNVTSTCIENLSNTVSYVGLIHVHSNFIAILPTCKFVKPCMWIFLELTLVKTERKILLSCVWTKVWIKKGQRNARSCCLVTIFHQWNFFLFLIRGGFENHAFSLEFFGLSSSPQASFWPRACWSRRLHRNWTSIHKDICIYFSFLRGGVDWNMLCANRC